MFFIDYILILVVFLFLFIGLLIGVSFLTLFERKVLGYIQIRKGSAKVGFMGIFQPFGDGIKLFTKEQAFPSKINFILYYFSPIFNLFLSIFI